MKSWVGKVVRFKADSADCMFGIIQGTNTLGIFIRQLSDEANPNYDNDLVHFYPIRRIIRMRGIKATERKRLEELGAIKALDKTPKAQAR